MFLLELTTHQNADAFSFLLVHFYTCVFYVFFIFIRCEVEIVALHSEWEFD